MARRRQSEILRRRILVYPLLLAGLLASSVYTASQYNPSPSPAPPWAIQRTPSLAEPPPTIVLIISDDHLYRDYGFAGNAAAHTPTIDRLAEEGALFPVAHVGLARCRPSLACLLAGTYPHQNRIYYNTKDKPNLDPRLETLPRQLRDQGYLGWVGGKYWEGDPTLVGFTHGRRDDERLVRRDQRSVESFLDEAAGQPAFLWWAPMLPHYPHDPSDELLGLIDEALMRRPPYVRERRLDAWRLKQKKYLAMGAQLDRGIADLLELLERAGRLDNTLIAYVADNGWDSSAPAKGTVYERGVRTPVILWDPSRIEPMSRPEGLISALDVVPTILEWAGAEIPDSFQGQSLWPLLSGEDTAWRSELFGVGYPFSPTNPANPDVNEDLQALYVRSARWKYVLFVRDLPPGSEWAEAYERNAPRPSSIRAGDEWLFDLEVDPEELENLTDDPLYADQVRRFRTQVFEWWQSTGGGPLPIGPEDFLLESASAVVKLGMP